MGISIVYSQHVLLSYRVWWVVGVAPQMGRSMPALYECAICTVVVDGLGRASDRARSRKVGLWH